MIKTINELRNNTWCRYLDIISKKSDNPITGDIYCDNNRDIYVYVNNRWENVIIKNKQVLHDRTIRINKIKKIFNG